MTTMKWFGQREETGEPDFYIYDEIPDELRGKLRFAIMDCLGRVEKALTSFHVSAYELAAGLVARAFGRGLAGIPAYGLDNFLINANLTDLLRGIEAILESLARAAEYRSLPRGELTDLTRDINKLFGHYHLGYRIEEVDSPREDEPSLQVIRVDSEFTHKEMVKPTLRQLQREGFETAAQQFSDALAEYTDGHYGDAITDANSSFESVLKRVLNQKAGTAHRLIGDAQKAGYFPSYLGNRAAKFSDLLEALPIVRDQEGDAHGKLEGGADMERFARYAIHLAATNIIFIVDEYNRRRSAQ